LILGGYDEGLVDRSKGRSASYMMADDRTNNFKVWLSETSFFSGNSKTTNTRPELQIPIEPLTAQMWLPASLCTVFESEFGLIYDAQMNLYFLNETQHDLVLRRKTSVMFSLKGDLNQFSSSGPPESASITFPYTDFVHNASYPFVPTPRRYFPLRRAANETQYALGRAYMQGAYLSADYQSRRFNIMQVRTKKHNMRETNFTKAPLAISLDSPKDSMAYSSAGQTSYKMIVGTVLPCVAILGAMIGILQWFRLKRRRSTRLASNQDVLVEKRASDEDHDPFHFHTKPELHGNPTLPPEADSGEIKELEALQAPNELENRSFGYELPAEVPGELYGDMPALELDATRKKNKLKGNKNKRKSKKVKERLCRWVSMK